MLRLPQIVRQRIFYVYKFCIMRNLLNCERPSPDFTSFKNGEKLRLQKHLSEGKALRIASCFNLFFCSNMVNNFAESANIQALFHSTELTGVVSSGLLRQEISRFTEQQILNTEVMQPAAFADRRHIIGLDLISHFPVGFI